MSRPVIRRFKNTKSSLGESEQVYPYLKTELSNLLGELDDAFSALTFADNFAGKIVEVSLEAFTETVIPNPLALAPNLWLAMGGKVPGVIQGQVWDKDRVSFSTVHGRAGTIGSGITFDAASNEVRLSGFPIFLPGMEVVFRLVSGTMPGGIVAGRTYWVKGLTTAGSANFTLSESPGGPTLDITSAGSGDIRVAARGTLKILLMR